MRVVHGGEGLRYYFSRRARVGLVQSLAASKFSCLRGSPLVLKVCSSGLRTRVFTFIRICRLETAVSSALNMLVTPYTRELRNFNEPSGHPRSALATLGTPQRGGPRVH